MKSNGYVHAAPSGPCLPATGPPTKSHHRFSFLEENSAFSVERCLSLMQAGSAMTKLKGSPRGLPRVYFLDRQRSSVCWRPSRKQDRAKISIDSVREVCEGRESEAFQRMECSSIDLACCLSVYHGTGLEPLALVAGSPQEAQAWLTGLHFLMARILGEDCLVKRQRTRDRYPYCSVAVLR
uniref:1-phosphatidylinositol 4,5-bisphosphate phosphodiesterase eta-2-like n=1 Tax=Myxine glutinosa TaxID=7769 RepID=UPI00358E40EF